MWQYKLHQNHLGINSYPAYLKVAISRARGQTYSRVSNMMKEKYSVAAEIIKLETKVLATCHCHALSLNVSRTVLAFETYPIYRV